MSDILASILIPTYNRHDSLRRALVSLQMLDFARERYEVVVIDNNSTDATPEVAAQFGTRYVKEPRLSFTVARRTGAEAALGKYLIYIDDDVTVEPQWLSAIIAAFEQSANVGMVAGPIRGVYEQTPPEWVKKQDPIMVSLYERDDDHEPPACLGPNLSIRRDVFFRVGGFPPDTLGVESQGKPGTFEKLYVGTGDSGISFAVRQAGYRIAFAPKAVVYHHIPPVRTTEQWWHSRYAGEGCCLAISEQRAAPVSRQMLLWRSAKSTAKAVAHALVQPVIAVAKEPHHNAFMTSFHRAQARAWWALANQPTLTDELWSLALSGVPPADSERLFQLAKYLR
jgi:GT2 family glycosyltransferase